MAYPRGAHRLSGGRNYRRVAATQQNDATGSGSGSSGAAAPANTVAPAVTGTATVGQTLTTGNGTWSNTPTSYTYQWQRAGVNIGSATASTYVLVDADFGSAIRCVVTATNSSGSASANSNATAAVASAGGTFGRTSIAGTSTSSCNNNQQRANKRTVAFHGTVSKISIYLANPNASPQTIKAAIWADSAGSAGALLASSSGVVIAAGAAAAWVDFTLSLAITPTDYWLGFLCGTTDGQANAYYVAGASGVEHYFSFVGTSPTNPFGAQNNWTEDYALYATYV